MQRCDVLVVGAGFGGLAAALSLAESGLRVVLCETLKYPGGCASTFTRHHRHFEAGATLFAGMEDTQLFGQWIRRYDLPVVRDTLDPVIELRTTDWNLSLHARRNSVRDQLCAMDGAPTEALQRFFALQERIAAALWPIFDAPDLLPPLSPAAWKVPARRITSSGPKFEFPGTCVKVRVSCVLIRAAWVGLFRRARRPQHVAGMLWDRFPPRARFR